MCVCQCDRFTGAVAPSAELLQGVKLFGGQGVCCMTDAGRPPSRLHR